MKKIMGGFNQSINQTINNLTKNTNHPKLMHFKLFNSIRLILSIFNDFDPYYLHLIICILLFASFSIKTLVFKKNLAILGAQFHSIKLMRLSQNRV